ncbi:hypothetical protein EB796_008007 [Bugula neritina]|uniref:Uncharacterized protein n=1 Tax=Bugula neritina TaxID=10212 RepID=A0A7J7K4X2_BUGNE|nr:hypothetical protein EB796_008007 [Bugula neritina]
MGLLTSEFKERENNLIAIYYYTKQAADSKKAYEEIKLKMEKEAKANALRFAHITRELEQAQEHMAEIKRSSEMREQKYQEMLDKMEKALGKDRGYYEQEIKKYQESIQAERNARYHAERINGEKIDELNETLQNLNSSEQIKNEFAEEMAALDKKYSEAIANALKAKAAQSKS